MMGEVLRRMKDQNLEPEDVKFSPENLAELILLVEKGTVNNQNAKKVFREIFERDVKPEMYVKQQGMGMVADTGSLEKTVEEVIAENLSVVEEYLSGKEKVFGFLVGQVMKKTRGQADPGTVNTLLRKRLGACSG